MKDVASQRHIIAQTPQTYLISKQISLRQDSFNRNWFPMVYKCISQSIWTFKLGFNQCVIKIDSSFPTSREEKFSVEITSLRTSISCYKHQHKYGRNLHGRATHNHTTLHLHPAEALRCLSSVLIVRWDRQTMWGKQRQERCKTAVTNMASHSRARNRCQVYFMC